jgi:predicted transcriptional regulator
MVYYVSKGGNMKQLPKGWKVIQGSKLTVTTEKAIEQTMREYAEQVDSEIEAAMKECLDEQELRHIGIIMRQLHRREE